MSNEGRTRIERRFANILQRGGATLRGVTARDVASCMVRVESGPVLTGDVVVISAKHVQAASGFIGTDARGRGVWRFPEAMPPEAAHESPKPQAAPSASSSGSRVEQALRRWMFDHEPGCHDLDITPDEVAESMEPVASGVVRFGDVLVGGTGRVQAAAGVLGCPVDDIGGWTCWRRMPDAAPAPAPAESAGAVCVPAEPPGGYVGVLEFEDACEITRDEDTLEEARKALKGLLAFGHDHGDLCGARVLRVVESAGLNTSVRLTFPGESPDSSKEA